MTMRVVHCRAVKLSSVFRRMLAPCGHWSVVSLAIVEMMIDVSVEVLRAMEPWSGPDKYTSREPLGAVESIGSAVVRRRLVVPVRANGRLSDTNGNLCGRLTGGGQKQARSSNTHET